MALYATVQEIKGLGLQTDAPDNTIWDLLAEGAARQFDRLCEVKDNFFAAAEMDDSEPPEPVYSSRTFIGDGTAYLKLDPFVELNPVTPIVIDAAYSYPIPEYTVVDRTLVVLNRTKYQEPIASAFPNRFTGWKQGVQVSVSAHWGFTTTPAEVKIAVCKLALISWRLADPVNAENTAAESEPLVDGIPASVWSVVEKYRERYSEAALFA